MSWNQPVDLYCERVGTGRLGGFRDIGVARGIGFKFGGFVDVVYMQLPLQDGQRG